MPAKSATAPRQAHDPAGRRRRIVAATVEILAEVGIDRTTHRLIASRAGVPLGATTYYFPTLHDLVKTAIDRVVFETREYVCSWDEPLAGSSDIPQTLVDLVSEYIERRERALMEYDIYLASARNPELKPLAGIWRDEVPTMLERHVAVPCARAISIILNGVMFESVVGESGVDGTLLYRMLQAVIDDLHS